MSASPLMSLGLKALNASYAGLQVTGHNIANANVAGYSRQQVTLATSQGTSSSVGFYGRGVDIQSVTRAHDVFLTREAAVARSLSAMDAARLSQLQRLETQFPLGETGLGAATGALMNAFTDLSNRPADLSARQVVLARARDLADRISQAGAAFDEIQAGVNAELYSSVSRVNSLAQSLASVNARIAESRGTTQAPNDLLDERDRLLSQLSDQVQITRIEGADGTMSVFVAGGQSLVLGSKASTLKLVPDAEDGSRLAVAIVDGGASRNLDATSLGGGAIAGLLRFQNEDLVAARTLVGQLAVSVGSAINEQQMRGLNLQPPAGTVPSSAMFALGTPQALPNAANARDAGGAPIGSVSLAIVDASALRASEYTLQETSAGSGSWVLTRLSDGRQTAVNDGDVVDGMEISFGSPPPQGGDRYRLQPVTRAANDFAALLNDPLDIAAAAPLMASVASGNTGTAAVSGFAMQAAATAVTEATTTISFTNDSGDYDWELRDPGGALLASGSGTWSAGGRIPASGVEINGFSLQLSGVPRSGDVITVEPTPPSVLASNNGNATALQALRDTATTGGSTATEAWANALADIGVRVQSARTAADISQSIAAQAETQRAGHSGVNIDEEAARLIQYQQSYQAAAKVLQVAQTLFQSLLDAAGG